MQEYDRSRYASTYADSDGGAIWAFLNEIENVVRMETATYLRRPAAEALSPSLLERFGEPIRENRVKQMIGHMVRQVLEAKGYRIDRNSVRIGTPGNIFTTATRYTCRSDVGDEE